MIKIVKTLLKSYKYRINPSETQKEKLSHFFGCARFVYNWGLNRKSEIYSSTKENVSFFTLAKEVTNLKKEKDFEWLKDVHSQTLQMSLRNLDVAYTNFFKKRGDFPKFKKKSNRQSFQYPQGVKIKSDKVFLPKIGWVKYFNSRDFEGNIKTVTVSLTSTGKYFVSVLVDNGKELPTKKPIIENTTVGLDFGIKDLVITSDGEVFENQKHFSKMKKTLRVEQRSLSRKKKGSNNYKKQRLVVAKVYEKITNQRFDYLHKISNQLVNEFDTICIEDLSVESMLKEKKMSALIADASWRTLRTMLEYKCEWRGKNLSVIGRFEPSSKRCSNCGNINKNLKLSDRAWTCKNCSVKLDRDINAAKNIKQYGVGTQPLPLNVGQ